MKVGLQIPFFDWPGSPENIGPVLLEIARVADQGGFASLWLMDRFLWDRVRLGRARRTYARRLQRDLVYGGRHRGNCGWA